MGDSSLAGIYMSEAYVGFVSVRIFTITTMSRSQVITPVSTALLCVCAGRSVVFGGSGDN